MQETKLQKAPRGISAPVQASLSYLRAALPQGRPLPEDVWQSRHRAIVVLLWLHFVGVACFGILTNHGIGHSLTEAALIAAFAALATTEGLGRRIRSTLASFGLLTASAALVHLSGGYIELHFHFFVMVAVIALYQDWIPFLLAIGYVVVQHGVMGALDPTSVYNHPDAWANPWKWAAIHGVFIVGISIASIVNWRFNEAARAKTELVLNSVGDGICGVDFQGNITFVNPTAATMLGWKDHELIGRPMLDIAQHSKSGETQSSAYDCPVLVPITTIPRAETAYEAKNEVFQRKDGTTFPVEYVSTPLEQNGRVIGAVIVFKDITERKQAEHALRTSEQRYRLLFERNFAGVYRTTAAGRILDCNDAFVRILGYSSRDEILETSATELYFDIADRQAYVARLQEHGVVDNVEICLRRKDGTPVWVLFNASLVESDEDNSQVVEGTLIDISERKQAEESLRASEAGFRVMFSDNPLPMWVYDTHTLQFLEVNEAAIEHYGYSHDEFLGMRITDIRPEEDVPRLIEDLERQRTKLERSKQWRHRRKNGQIIDVQISSHTLILAGREAVLVVVRDITEQMRIEEERRAKEAAEAANRAKSEFLSRMSHELRTPLNSILGFAQLLRMDSTTPEQHESVDYIVKGGKHLLELINEVLDIARIETGKLTISVEPVSLIEVLQECLDLVRPMAAQRELRLQTGPSLQQNWFVMADRQRFKQVLINLLSNAIKYNREGGSVSVACEQLIGSRLRIWVSDTGHGIAPEKVKLLFTPFERLGAEQSTVEGTGLGLALSKHLVDAMDGSIGVDSEVGAGSTFWVDLPEAEGQVQQFERAGTGPLSLDRMPVQARKILYIEDNLSNLKLIERILAQRPDLKLISAMQGGLGVELAHQHHPDLILLDLHLPDIPGDEVLRRLRENPDTDSIPVVIISADATPRQIEQLLAAGAQAYLTKPLDLMQFAQVLEQNFAKVGVR